MNYTWATASHVGHLRDNNEDAVVPRQDGAGPGPVILAVADGMGGHVAGEVASDLAIEAAMDPTVDIDIDARSRVEMGNKAVIEAIDDDPRLTGMGTTLTLGLFEADGTLHIGHVGDSRLYLLRDGVLSQITRDHTWVADMISAGRITEKEATTHPRRHLLTRVLGTTTIEVDQEDLQLENGDRVLICSDGLTTMLRDNAMAEILGTAETPSDTVWALIESANAAGGYDNTTVAVVDVAS